MCHRFQVNFLLNYNKQQETLTSWCPLGSMVVPPITEPQLTIKIMQIGDQAGKYL